MTAPIHHPHPAESDRSTSAAALSDRIAPEDRESGSCKFEQPLAGKDCDCLNGALRTVKLDGTSHKVKIDGSNGKVISDDEEK
jgi:hypothetical protein